MTELELRPAGPDDTDALCALIGRIFPDNPKADPAVLRWQFWDNPFGRAASWVMTDGDRLVCHFAVLPVPARLDGRRVTAAKPADAATDPDYRGQGLMGRTARAVFEECAERDIPVTICLPNFRARGALRKIGMAEVAPVRAYVLPLDDGWLADRFRLPRPIARAVRATVFSRRTVAGGRQVDAPPEGLDELWRATAAQVPNGVVHDAAWWRWRYVDRPGGTYRFHEVRRDGRLVAAAVSTVRDAFGARFVHLLDLQATGAAEARAVMTAALDEPDGAVGAATIAMPDTRIARLAGACGFRRLPRRLEPNEQILGLFHNDPSLGDLTDRDWTVTWTDLDHL